jgi:hypothetical protein
MLRQPKHRGHWHRGVDMGGLTVGRKIGYDRRLSICSGKDNKAESAK